MSEAMAYQETLNPVTSENTEQKNDKMRKIILNNQMGENNTIKFILIAIPYRGILNFTGESIPPIIQVTDIRHSGKEGRYTNWYCEVSSDCHVYSFWQNRFTRKWFSNRTWKSAINHFFTRAMPNDEIKATITNEMVEKAIRALLPEEAARLDRLEKEYQESMDDMDHLFEAQNILAQARQEEQEIKDMIEKQEQAERMKEEAYHVRNRVEKAKDLLKQGPVNLSELKDILNKPNDSESSE